MSYIRDGDTETIGEVKYWYIRYKHRYVSISIQKNKTVLDHFIV